MRTVMRYVFCIVYSVRCARTRFHHKGARVSLSVRPDCGRAVTLALRKVMANVSKDSCANSARHLVVWQVFRVLHLRGAVPTVHASNAVRI